MNSITMTTTQNSYFSSEYYMTMWGSLRVEDIVALASHNDTRQIEFMQSWSQGNLSDIDWQYYDMFMRRYLEYFEIHVKQIWKTFAHKGTLLIQCLARCTSSLDDVKDFTYRLALDGEELVSINATDSEWTAGSAPLSKYVQSILQKDKVTMQSVKILMLNYCYSLALTYSVAGKEAYSKKIQPQVYITSKSKSETEVICMVTGFYPKPINVSLWKENTMEDVMSTETLPNGDGTYQITVLANINSAEQERVYCRVEHSSLEEPMIVHLDKTHHSLNGLVVAIIVAFVCVVGLACLVSLYTKRRRYTFIAGMTMNRLSWRRNKNIG